MLSSTPITYRDEEICAYFIYFLRYHFWAIMGFMATFGYLATSCTECDIIFLLNDPNFL